MWLNRELGNYKADEVLTVRSAAAIEHLFDAEKGLFLSGAEKQVSWDSNINRECLHALTISSATFKE